MTNTIQAAIEKTQTAIDYAIEESAKHGRWFHSDRDACHAAIRSLAALVREYGHGPHCACHDDEEEPLTVECKQATDEFYGGHEHPYCDPRCLPESREVKS